MVFVEVVNELLKALPELSMTVDASNTTALNTAATQGHMEVVRLLLEADASLAVIARSNGKTALHSAARNGHVEVVRALMEAEPSIAARVDKKGQTALHMAAKGTRLDIVDALLAGEPTLLNLADSKGNTALHIAARKARTPIVKRLLELPDTDLKAINRSRETAFDTAEKMGNTESVAVLAEHGVPSARAMSPTGGGGGNPGRELKQQVSDIKHEVHSQLEQTRQTRVRMQGIAKQINKLHDEGLNNAINSTTVVAVLIATVAFAAAFAPPGDYGDDGAPRLANRYAFDVFIIANTLAFICAGLSVISLTYAGVAAVDMRTRMISFVFSASFMACSARSLGVAFAFGMYVVLAPVARTTAIAACVITGLALADVAWFVFVVAAGEVMLLKRLGIARAWWRLPFAIMATLLMQFWPYIVIVVVVLYSKIRGVH